MFKSILNYEIFITAILEGFYVDKRFHFSFILKWGLCFKVKYFSYFQVMRKLISILFPKVRQSFVNFASILIKIDFLRTKDFEFKSKLRKPSNHS
jgi:hypothetical protein